MPLQHVNNEEIEYRQYVVPDFDFDGDYDFPDIDTEIGDVSGRSK